jgi:hypothetical protein
MKYLSVLGLILLTTVCTGCMFHYETTGGGEDEGDMGSHHVVVRPGANMVSSSSSSGGGSESHTFQCGGTNIEIRDEELTVNGVPYGMLSPGEEILVDHGEVFVGGVKREVVSSSP